MERPLHQQADLAVMEQQIQLQVHQLREPEAVVEVLVLRGQSEPQVLVVVGLEVNKE